MKKSSKKGGGVREKSNQKGKVTRIIHESTKEIKIERVLLENFIALQKVMVNLSAKFDNLSGQISKLLELFEISAKSLARKDFEDGQKEGRNEKVIMEKLDNLAQQAGLIGKGLALIHETNSEKYLPGRQVPTSMPSTSVRQMIPMDKPKPQLPQPTQEYQKSASSKVSEIKE